jgi:hypothetical protein
MPNLILQMQTSVDGYIGARQRRPGLAGLGTGGQSAPGMTR